jgi:hypothetical protein
MVRYKIMTIFVNLDSYAFYTKIWIWPYLGHITRLNRIILSLFKKIHPRILDRISNDFSSLLFKPSEFPYY